MTPAVIPLSLFSVGRAGEAVAFQPRAPKKLIRCIVFFPVEVVLRHEDYVVVALDDVLLRFLACVSRVRKIEFDCLRVLAIFGLLCELLLLIRVGIWVVFFPPILSSTASLPVAVFLSAPWPFGAIAVESPVCLLLSFGVLLFVIASSLCTALRPRRLTGCPVHACPI